jgi:formimidoylglutamate deiminase
MMRLLAPSALLPDGWAEDVLLEIGPDGDFTSVSPGRGGQGWERLAGPVLPGMPNLHSHAFQRAMVGLTQRLQPGEASFWTWRETMYRFLATLEPPDVEAIAAQLYVELLKGGYTGVVEFHYLHHAPDGQRYADAAAMSWAIDAAARMAGIGLTLAPVLYMSGGFGGAPLEESQRRFRMDPGQAFELLERLGEAFAGDPDRAVALAPHSLRAVPGPALVEAVDALHHRDPSAPVHIHVAEQVREVRECLEHHGRRPLQRLFDLVTVDRRWCLIHATHLDDDEVEAFAGSGAVAGLCPTTEADLGDGIFRLADHLAAGGRFGIGSDSQVGTTAPSELRLLEYGQRLTQLRRLVASNEIEPSCGARLWRAALEGGAQASGRRVGRIAPGYRADLLVLDASAPDVAAHDGNHRLDALILGPTACQVQDVLVGGRWVVQSGRHPRQSEIAHRYVRTVRCLLH